MSLLLMSSQVFGPAVVDKFLSDNDFDLFVRAHQVVEDGYEFFPADDRKLVTVFSAANYCGQFDNAGAMLIVDADMICSFHVMCPLERQGTFPYVAIDTFSLVPCGSCDDALVTLQPCSLVFARRAETYNRVQQRPGTPGED